MRLPRLRFLEERAALRAFESQDASFRQLVFYSEGPGDWPHIGPVVEELLEHHDQPISYLSSDADDPGLALVHPNLRAFSIGAGTVRTIGFARIDCRRFVMTLPDLGQLWLKRSVHRVEYVYMFHSINSTHTSYRKGAFDQFDTILSVGPHHLGEIRASEARYGLPTKRIIEHGSTKLDTVLAAVERASVEPKPSEDLRPRLLIAPSWGECSLIERPVGVMLIDALLGAGLPTVLRLHPMTVRRCPDLVSRLRSRFDAHPRFRLEADMSAMDSWLHSDLMISDWSGAATEFAFSLLKPVLYIDTPAKRVNPDWQEIRLPAFEDVIRSQVGRVVGEDDVASVPDVVADLVATDRSAERARNREGAIFNVGLSTAVAASYLADAG